MKSEPSVALLAAGRIRDSFLRNVPRLEEILGPVRSSSLRLASRICGILGAGRPADSVMEFDGCDVILISMPEPWIPPAVDELADSGIDWKSKTVLLCDPLLESTELNKLSFLGAAAGSITPVQGFDDKLFAAEGQRRAIRDARALLESRAAKVVTIETGRKAEYAAGLSFATGLVLPLLTACVETLRSSGLDPNQSSLIAERLFNRALQSYSKGGRKSWEGPLAAQDIPAIRRHIQALIRMNPAIGAYYQENAILVAQMMRQDPGWLTKLAEELYPPAAS